MMQMLADAWAWVKKTVQRLLGGPDNPNLPP